MQYPGDDDALVFVQGMIEQAHDKCAIIEHEILSNVAARICETLREGFGLRYQQQAGRLGSVSGNHHRFGALEDLTSRVVEIDGSAHPAVVSNFDLSHIG